MCTLRVYRSCFFFIGTKIPFSQWPSLDCLYPVSPVWYTAARNT